MVLLSQFQAPCHVVLKLITQCSAELLPAAALDTSAMHLMLTRTQLFSCFLLL
jgi:hypothetical protein